MAFVLAVIGGLVVLAVVVAVWVWWSMPARDQVAEQVRIRVEEQLALWRMQAISRQAQAEMRRIRDEHRRHSFEDQ